MEFSITDIRKSYGPLTVLDGIDLSCRAGEVTVLLGPSGCGKTTLLNILAGLDKDYSGGIGAFAETRASYIFQEDRLLPWLSALDNVAFVLKPHMQRHDRRREAGAILALLGLGRERHMLPHQLSGGMRRRVAMARAFACPSSIMLLDEPFSSLDLKTRIAVMDAFLDLHRRDGRTALVVTHDVREAIYLGNTIVTLSEKPARVRDSVRVDLPATERAFASPAAAGIEARLYASILS